MEKEKNLHGISNEDLFSILDCVNDAVFVDDAQGYNIWINRACEEIYKIRREEAAGKHLSFFEEAEIFKPSVARLVIEKKEEAHLIHKNRDGKRLIITGIPLFDERGALSKVVTTSRDITELLELQAKLEMMQNNYPEGEGIGGFIRGNIIANSPAMYKVIQLADRLSKIDSTVLLTGESGSGKGVIAKMLHETGNRKDQPFVQINCGAIPDNLLESELFGYEKGAFTGSLREGKVGLFETADKGTIFLDEISELPLNLQVKILQVLQEKKIQPVGGRQQIPVDVRVISATNKDLAQMVEEKKFREDLYYRLNVVPLHIPPLRERRADIAPLIHFFLRKNNQKFGENKIIDSEALEVFLNYLWPGNVRELENLMERLIITTRDNVIRASNLPEYLKREVSPAAEALGVFSGFVGFDKPNEGSEVAISLKEALKKTEGQILEQAMKTCRTTREMARALGISQPSVVRKMAEHGLKERK